MAGEMDDEKWEKLRHVYLHLKQYWTEHTDWDRFDELMTRFPENGTMTTYREILPYAKHLTFMRGEILWLAVDPIASTRTVRAVKPPSVSCKSLGRQDGARSPL